MEEANERARITAELAAERARKEVDDIKLRQEAELEAEKRLNEEAIERSRIEA